MAKGDRTPKEWLQKPLTITNTDSTIVGALNVRRYVSGITVSLQTAGATKRTVTVYQSGTATANELCKLYVDPAGITVQILTQLPYFIENGDTMYFKQDVGSDVNIIVHGIEEELV